MTVDYDQIPAQLDAPHRRCLVGGEPQIFHCHHYNNYLQRTLTEDVPYLDTTPILRGAAAEVAHHQLSNLFTPEMDVAARQGLAEALFAWSGFGRVDFSQLDAGGGVVESPGTHYSLTWEAKFGPSKTPVDYFASGWLAGALAAVHGKDPGSYASVQTRCAAMEGVEGCAFELQAGAPNYEVYTPVGVGALTDHQVVEVEENNVDYEGILGALAQMPLVGGEDGIIRAFGAYLTRHYANYYNRISFEFVRAMEAKFPGDGRAAAEPLLIEAGHQCAFYTFGGIMTSTEWDALILPQLKTKADWLHGITACVNALGWGRWQVTDVSEDGARFVLHDDYESVGYLGAYGEADHDVCYLADGGVSGALDLVYLADIASKPTLDPEFYASLFKNKASYSTRIDSCRARGASVTDIRVLGPGRGE